MALKRRRGFGRGVALSKAVVLRRISASFSDASDGARVTGAQRAKTLEETLCFWATRTALEREFYLHVYILGELDSSGRVTSDREAKQEWERSVHLPTEIALTLIGLTDGNRAGLFRRILGSPQVWSYLKLIYRTWVEERWPRAVRDSAEGGWEQDPLVPEWSGELRTFIVHSPQMAGE